MSAAPDLTTPPASPADLLRERFVALKRQRIRIHPCHSVRASSIGHECERFLFYEQTAHELRQPHKEELQMLFDLGNELESFAVREIEAMGVRVHQRGRDYHDREHNITGHVDAKLEIPGVEPFIPLELKGLNPFTAEKCETLGDIRDSPQAWVRKYYAQLVSYLYLDKSRLGMFGLLNKVTGEIKFIECPADDEFAQQLLAKADRVNAAVKAKEPPPRHQTGDCQRCPFAHVCLPDLDFGPGTQVLDMPELIAALETREKYSKEHALYSAADKAVKELLPDVEHIIAGEFVIERKKQSRKSFVMPASEFWKNTIRHTKPNGEKK